MRTRRIHAAIVAEDNVRAAAKEACHGKRRRPAVARFLVHREAYLAELISTLQTQSWRPRGYRTLVIREPKPRLIAVAPFRDRVVHHAIHRVIEPLLTRSFVHDNYACRAGRGTHRAVLRFQEGLRTHPWVGRIDVRQFFMSVHWRVLEELLAQRVRDAEGRALLSRVIESGVGLYSDDRLERRGLPIGNLTSQLFANFYLDGLDHFALRDLKVPLCLRYMDDAMVFGPTRGTVNRWLGAMSEWLWSERRLRAHDVRGAAQDTRGTFRFLGYVVDRTQRRIAARSVRRTKAKLRARCWSGLSAEDALELARWTDAVTRSWYL